MSVTIGICVYNPNKLFIDCVKSALNQSLEANEILIVDDYSKVKITSLLFSNSKNNHLIKIVRNKENMGIGYCRNLITEIAKNKFICFFDSDDVSHPSRLETCHKSYLINKLDEHLNLVYCKSRKIYLDKSWKIEESKPGVYEKNSIIKNSLIKGSQSGVFGATSTLFFNRDEVLSKFNVKFRRLEDVEWLWKNNIETNINVIVPDIVLVNRNDLRTMTKLDNNLIYEKLLIDEFSFMLPKNLSNFHKEWFTFRDFYYRKMHFRMIAKFIMLLFTSPRMLLLKFKNLFENRKNGHTSIQQAAV